MSNSRLPARAAAALVAAALAASASPAAADPSRPETARAKTFEPSSALGPALRPGLLLPPREPAGARADRPRPRPRPVGPTGRLVTVGGADPRSGPGDPRRFLVEVEQGVGVAGRAFAAAVRRILYDRRGWARGGRLAFVRVATEPADFRVALASPATTDRLCAPLETGGIFSCHQNGRAVINLRRWRTGARSYAHDLRGYRAYLINHEVGHALGHSWHRPCPSRNAPAPVMMQQTIGVEGCRPNPWPLAAERDALP